MQIFSDEMYKATAYYVNENILKPISSYVQSNPLTHELNNILPLNWMASYKGRESNYVEIRIK